MRKSFTSVRIAARRNAIAVAVAAAMGTGSVQAANVTWVGPNNSFWDLAANWNPGLPGAPDDVLLGISNTEFRSGSVTVQSFNGTGVLTISGGALSATLASSIGALIMTGGTMGGTGTVTVGGASTWTAGTHTGAGTTSFNGALALSGSGTKAITGGRTVNAANTTWSGNTASNNNLISIAGAAVLNNTGTFTDANTFDSSISAGGGGATFNNNGVFNKQSNTTTSIGTVFNSSGTVNVNAGTLLQNGGGTNSGVINIASGAMLEYRNGSHTLNNVTTSGLGTLQISTENVGADALVTINGGTHTTAVLFSGSTIAGTDHTFQGPVTWTGGTLTGAASTTLTNAVTTISGANTKVLSGGRVLNLQGATTWSGNTGANNNSIS